MTRTDAVRAEINRCQAKDASIDASFAASQQITAFALTVEGWVPYATPIVLM